MAYYNYRYYSPAMGRWLSRDPIEEDGGRNIYAFVKNNVLDKWDYLGLTVTALYNIRAQRFSIVDDDVGGSIATIAISGGRWDTKNNIFIPNTIGNSSVSATYSDIGGPTIPGKYYIGKANEKNATNGWFGLYNEETLSLKYSFGRSGFFLHLGTYSTGCVTVVNKDAAAAAQWNNISNMIISTKTKKVGYLGLQSGCFTIYGELTVNE